MQKINKNLYLCLFLLFFIISFFIKTDKVLAATINFYPSSGTYQVGDIIKVQVNISSDSPVNAFSGDISFPTNILTPTSLTKDLSIVNLWAQEPSLLDSSSGLIKFEGVILDGYTGNSGNILTINFKAQSEGVAILKLSNTSILANDGNGTEVFSGNNLIIASLNIKKKINIEKPQSIINCIDKYYFSNTTELQDSREGESVLSCMAVNSTEKIKEIEISNHLINNSLLVSIIIIGIIMVTLVFIYLVYFIIKLKKYFKYKIKKIEKVVSNNFKNLENDVELKDQKNDRINQDKGISVIDKVENTEGKIIKEIKEEI